MAFDALVANPGRLAILTELAVEERQEFVRLRRRTRLTDGNLAAHGKRLSAAGLIAIDKQFRDGKPVTTYLLTSDGRKALEAHARRLFAAITHRRLGDSTAVDTAPSRTPPPDETVVEEPAAEYEDWVD